MIIENTLQNAYRDYKKEITEIIRSNLTPKLLKERLLVYHANDIALALEELNKEERLKLYSILGIETLAEVLEYSDSLELYLNELTLRKRVYVLSHIEVSVAVAYLENLKKNERDDIIELLDDETKKEIHIESYNRLYPLCFAHVKNFLSLVGLPDIPIVPIDFSQSDININNW